MNQLQPAIAEKVCIFALALIHCVPKPTCCAMLPLMNDNDSDGVLVHWALNVDFYSSGVGSCEIHDSVLICGGCAKVQGVDSGSGRENDCSSATSACMIRGKLLCLLAACCVMTTYELCTR